MAISLDRNSDLAALLHQLGDTQTGAFDIGFTGAQESRDALTKINKGRIQARYDPRDPAGKHIITSVALAGPVHVKRDQPVALHQGDAHGAGRRLGKNGIDAHRNRPRPPRSCAVSWSGSPTTLL